MNDKIAYQAVAVFDGTKLHWGRSLVLSGGIVEGIVDNNSLPQDYTIRKFEGQIVSPGFVDLQVNGGDGVLLSNDPSLETLKRMSTAHINTGTAAFLPTLTTDAPEKVNCIISAVSQAIQGNVPGIIGLHLEGPHLAKSKKGAHDAALIRSMEADDLETRCNAAMCLPSLMVTVAVEAVSPEQIQKLCAAGAIVSLGNTDGDHEACMKAVAAGATCAPHLYNAMSQSSGRTPGLVGAVLSSQQWSAGIIADGHHVHPANVEVAYRTKAPTNGLFLVSDAMALTGANSKEFDFGGGRVKRQNGRLELACGTLAAADIDLSTSVQNLMNFAHIDLEQALVCPTSAPAKAINRSPSIGSFVVGKQPHSLISFAANDTTLITSVKLS